jgi:DNA-binding NarL/FixJ family response regulator
MEHKEPVVRLEGIPIEIRRKALRQAMDEIPVDQLREILAECGLSEDEQRALVDHRDGADLTWIAQRISASDRTVDRRRSSALEKLRIELEQ